MLRDTLQKSLEKAVDRAKEAGFLPSVAIPIFGLEVPHEKKFGDYSSNIAFLFGKKTGLSPRVIARGLMKFLEPPPEVVENVHVGGPGFINFHLSREALFHVLRRLLQQRDSFGQQDLGHGERVRVIFSTANPAEHLQIRHGRWAVLGDALANLLAFTNHRVRRELFVLDLGSQMELLGRSVEARYRELLGDETPFPEDGYRGKYIVDMAREILYEDGAIYLQISSPERVKIFSDKAHRRILEKKRNVLARAGVRTEGSVSQRELYLEGDVDGAIEELRRSGLTKEQNGSLLFMDRNSGKEMTLSCSDGRPTSLLINLSYLRRCVLEGSQRMISATGLDGFQQAENVMAALALLQPEHYKVEYSPWQGVVLHRGDVPLKGARRSSDLLSFEEILDETGKDAARFLLLLRSENAVVALDLEQAKTQTRENPVYVLEQACSRISSLRRSARTRGISLPNPEEADLGYLQMELEMEILRTLERFPGMIRESAIHREPSHLSRYCLELANLFNHYYDHFRILTEDAAFTCARILLVEGIQIVIANLLRILGLDFGEMGEILPLGT